MDKRLQVFTTYVLFSEKFKKHYTGYTSNLEARLISHNELGSKDWATRYRPWKLIYFCEFNSISEATRHEKWLKSGVGREFIASIPH